MLSAAYNFFFRFTVSMLLAVIDYLNYLTTELPFLLARSDGMGDAVWE